MEVWRYGGMEVWRYGGMEAWRYGGMGPRFAWWGALRIVSVCGLATARIFKMFPLNSSRPRPCKVSVRQRVGALNLTCICNVRDKYM